LRDLLQPHDELVGRVTEIPGIAQTSAHAILSETGTTRESFPNAGAFCPWAGVCPANNESAGKRRSTRSPVRGSHLTPMCDSISNIAEGRCWKASGAQSGRAVRSGGDFPGKAQSRVLGCYKLNCTLVSVVITPSPYLSGRPDLSIYKRGSASRFDPCCRDISPGKPP
jgi:hypothetical protein